MCVVSNIGDYGRGVPWPNVPNQPPQPQPVYPQTPAWDRETFEMFKELLELGRKWDKQAGQPDCDVPDKLDWMEEVERRLKKLEEGE